jgi:hypothetical protein
MSDDLAAQLRKALDGSMEHSPSAHRLLYAAAIKIERLTALVARDKQ